MKEVEAMPPEIIFVDTTLAISDIIFYTQNIVPHNPNDPCQNIVRETMIKAVGGEIELHPHGRLYLTNGAAGYDMKKSFPDRVVIFRNKEW